MTLINLTGIVAQAFQPAPGGKDARPQTVDKAQGDCKILLTEQLDYFTRRWIT